MTDSAGHCFLQWQKLLGSSAEWVTGNNCCSHCVVDTDSTCSSSLVLAICIHLSLLVSGWGETKPRKRLGKLVLHPALPFPTKRTLSSREFPLGPERCQPGGWDDAGKWKLLFLFLMCSYSQLGFFVVMVVVPLCFLSFLSGFLTSPRLIFACGLLSELLIFVGR